MKNRKFVFLCATTILVTAVSVLIGWYLDNLILKSILPGFITMKANTAILLITSAITLLIARTQRSSNRNRRAIATLCGFSITISSLVIWQYFSGSNFGIDEFLFTDIDGDGRYPPGRLSPLVAINFILLSVAVIIQNLCKKNWNLTAQSIIIFVFFSAMQAFIGYSMGLTYIFGAAFYTQMALHTAVAFLLLSVGFLASRPNVGFVKIFMSKSPTARLAQRLLLVALLAPPITRWLSWRGVLLKIFDPEFESFIQAIGSMILTCAVVLLSMKKLNEIEDNRDKVLKLEKLARRDAEVATSIRDQFLSIASHELRTPLMSLQLQNEILQLQLESGGILAFDKQKLKAAFDLTERQIKWLSSLVVEMLDVTKINLSRGSLKKNRWDISDIVAGVVRRNQDGLNSVNFKPQPKPIIILCDRIQIERVFTNLITNALKYGKNMPIKIQLTKLDNDVEIAVTDQGLGIAQTDQDRVFAKYERATPEDEISGLGLGLFIAKEITQLHGGIITLKSQLGQGSTFTVRLPIG